MSEFEASNNVENQPMPNSPVPPAANGADALAIVSLVTGICGVVLGLVPVLGFLSAAAALVTGIIHLNQRRPGQGLAIAGLVTGGIGILGNLLFWGLVAIAIIGFSAGGSDPSTTANIALHIV